MSLDRGLGTGPVQCIVQNLEVAPGHQRREEKNLYLEFKFIKSSSVAELGILMHTLYIIGQIFRYRKIVATYNCQFMGVQICMCALISFWFQA